MIVRKVGFGTAMIERVFFSAQVRSFLSSLDYQHSRVLPSRSGGVQKQNVASKRGHCTLMYSPEGVGIYAGYTSILQTKSECGS
jgi:hypothetical protein